MTQEQIENLISLRSECLHANKYSEADTIEERVTAAFRHEHQFYPVDFILETLTHFGQAPALVYDDNGLFAVSGDGVQPVVMDDERLEGAITTLVEKEYWFPTIREAVVDYIKRNA